jgi:hypothetical protein
MPEYKELSVEVLRSTCKNCKNEFDVYKLPDFIYGERLLLTEDSTEYGYINCFNDKAFNEVGRIVDKLYEGKDLSQNRITECFNKILGLTCDLINGKRIDALRIKPSCQYCGSEILETKEYQVSKATNIKIPIVTHNDWEKKSLAEKEEYIASALKENNCI